MNKAITEEASANESDALLYQTKDLFIMKCSLHMHMRLHLQQKDKEINNVGITGKSHKLLKEDLS